MRISLTKKRLQTIVDALAYWETVIEGGQDWLWKTDSECRRLEHDRQQAFNWAHQQLAMRKTK